MVRDLLSMKEINIKLILIELQGIVYGNKVVYC